MTCPASQLKMEGQTQNKRTENHVKRVSCRANSFTNLSVISLIFVISWTPPAMAGDISSQGIRYTYFNKGLDTSQIPPVPQQGELNFWLIIPRRPNVSKRHFVVNSFIVKQENIFHVMKKYFFPKYFSNQILTLFGIVVWQNVFINSAMTMLLFIIESLIPLMLISIKKETNNFLLCDNWTKIFFFSSRKDCRISSQAYFVNFDSSGVLRILQLFSS